MSASSICDRLRAWLYLSKGEDRTRRDRVQIRRRGSAVILVLAILAAFAILAIAFCALMHVEETASANHLLQARARLSADAGVHRAIAELSASELDDPTGLSGGWLVHDPGVPIERASSYSWGSTDDLGPFCGILGGTCEDRGDRYLLRVADTSSRLDLGANPAFLGPALDVLGRALAEQRLRTGSGPGDPVRGRGAEIARYVQVQGAASVRQLAACIGADDASVLADFVTAHAVRDPLTVRWTGSTDGRGYPIFQPEPRAPVSVNTAAWPVLVAVFASVTGADGVPVSYDQARTLATWVCAWRASDEVDRGPITTWDAFARLVAGAAADAGLTVAQRDAVLANASPNLAIGELNPDAPGLALGDGGLVQRRTTELTLLTSGVYEIDALGRVLAPGSSLPAAEARVHAVARIFEIARHTSQVDFSRGTCDGTMTMPSPTNEAIASRWGYVELAVRNPPMPTQGAVVDFSSSALEPGIAGAQASGAQASGAAASFPGHAPNGHAWGFWRRFGSDCAQPMFVTQAPSLVGQVTDAGATTGPAGPLLRDGMRAAPRAQPVKYAIQPGGDEGSLSLWVKLGRDEVPGTIVEDERTVADGFAVRSRLTAGRTGSTLVLEYVRELLATGNAASPFHATSVTTRARVPGLGSPNEWHRIEVAWHDGVEQALSVDGSPLDVSEVDSRSAPATTSLVRETLAVGGDLSGNPSACHATIDGVVVNAGTRETPAPLDRFGLDDAVVGRFLGHFDGFESDAELGTLSWTALRPTRWGRMVYQDDHFALAVAAANQGQKAHLAGPGAPTKCAPPKKGPPTPPGPPPKPTPPTPAHAPPPGPAPPGALPPGPPPGPPPKAAPIAARVPPGAAGAADMPSVVHRGGNLDYEFDFLYDRSAQGKAAPPLCVTPVLEEVLLTYSTGPVVLVLETID